MDEQLSQIFSNGNFQDIFQKKMEQGIDSKVLDDVKKQLAVDISNLLQIMKTEYADVIPSENLKYLNEITNYEDIIKIEQTNTISMFVKDGLVYFPINAFYIIDSLKELPGFGINRDHKTFDGSSTIINDNTYLTYIEHVFHAGLTPLEFYEETLLHELHHLCGTGGMIGLREGFTELKTRELASKYHLKTSGCGYPKETKMALEIQNIFGEKVGDKIAFAQNSQEIIDLLEEDYDIETGIFYMNVQSSMQDTFQPYYHKQFPGFNGPLLKAEAYSEVNYDLVYPIIAEYKNVSMEQEKMR